jgi:hypothetical protein
MAVTQVITMYQICHTWIHLLSHSFIFIKLRWIHICTQNATKTIWCEKNQKGCQNVPSFNNSLLWKKKTSLRLFTFVKKKKPMIRQQLKNLLRNVLASSVIIYLKIPYGLSHSKKKKTMSVLQHWIATFYLFLLLWIGRIQVWSLEYWMYK